jgi:hypothetical protein
MKRWHVVLALALALAAAHPGRAAEIASHQGATDPLTEGFTFIQMDGVGIPGQVFNDMGFDAWTLVGSSFFTQTWYQTGALTPAQKAALQAEGWTASLRARVTEGAPALNVAFANLDTGTRRFDINLGLNPLGDTFVRLNTAVPGLGVPIPGPTFTLTGSGSTYHLFQLVYDPVSQSADLFVDGVERISDYLGHTDFVEDRGFYWGVALGAHGRFNLARLETGQGLVAVPEPSARLLLAAGGLGLLGHVLTPRVRGRTRPEGARLL